MKPEVLAELKPGATYVIELTEDLTNYQLANLRTSLALWGEPLGVRFLVLPRGLSIVRTRTGLIQRLLVRTRTGRMLYDWLS